ncbi:MAG: hypothetical protein CL583_01925 [Alteromonadaceae bacterium]|nr:hypothetical protein [Alteromonadaceae bacterium]|tara:strand:+ start:3863 stop:4291 length:429 start_codon:yes stop_codon:yes gene_type:complete
MSEARSIDVTTHEVKPVYPEFSYEGIRFALMPDGTVYARAKGVAEAEWVTRMTFSDSGNPWIPKHKNFNSLCRQFYREGDVDDLIAKRAAVLKREQALRRAASELYEAVTAMIDSLEGGATTPEEAIAACRAAKAKVDGGRS